MPETCVFQGREASRVFRGFCGRICRLLGPAGVWSSKGGGVKEEAGECKNTFSNQLGARACCPASSPSGTLRFFFRLSSFLFPLLFPPLHPAGPWDWILIILVYFVSVRLLIRTRRRRPRRRASCRWVAHARTHKRAHLGALETAGPRARASTNTSGRVARQHAE